MNLIAGTSYDPVGGVVTKSLASLLAMTALDTTNLRLTFTAPPSGKALVEINCAFTGATTTPSFYLGVLDGSTIKGRAVSMYANAQQATSLCGAYARFLVSGLTPGQSYTWDAAYAVEHVIASSVIKYGGPDDTTQDNAGGAFTFLIWDPQPQSANTQLLVDSAGRVDVSKVAGTTQTARDLGANLDAAVSSRLATSGYTAPLTAITTRSALGLASANLDTQLAAIAGYIDLEVGALQTDVTAIKAKTDSLTFTVANKLDVNALYVNGVQLTGAGTAGNPWGPA